MQLLIVKLKMIVSGILSVLLFSGLIACKETDGFSSAALGGGVGGAFLVPADAPLKLTDEASADIQTRIDELANIEEEVALKDQRVQQLEVSIEDQMADLQTKLEANAVEIAALKASSPNGVLNPNDVLNINQESANLRSQVDVLNAEYENNLSDYNTRYDQMLTSFSELVTELSKYETTEKSEAFRTLVSEKLKVYEADREQIAARISEREESIANLNKRIEELESNTSPEALVQRNELSTELQQEQEALNASRTTIGNLDAAIDATCSALGTEAGGTCIKDDQTTTATDLMAAPNQTTNRASVVSGQIFEVSGKINALKAEIESLKVITDQLDLKILEINNNISLQYRSRSQNQPILTQFQVEKSAALAQKGEALQTMTEKTNQVLALKITLGRLQRVVVGL